jgi:two-component system, LytTR family, response regulator
LFHQYSALQSDAPSLASLVGDVRILIADDQVETRNSLLRLSECVGGVQVVGAVACGAAAIEAAAHLHPDILLLAAELPDLPWFDVLPAISADPGPLGILTASCSHHAIRAFEEGVFDYLVQPVTLIRFARAMTRAHDRLNGMSLNCVGSPSPPRGDGSSRTPSPRYLVGERQRKLYPLDPKSIDYIESDGNYVTLRAGKTEYLSRDSLKRLAVELAALGFIRIERSLLVNSAAVEYAEVARHGTFALTLSSGVCLHSTAAYRDRILRVIPLPALSKRYRGAV